MTLAHIQLDSADIETHVQFYEKYYGFKRKPLGSAWLLWNRSGFMMAVNPILESPQMPEWFHVGFRFDTVEEVEAMRERFLADGYQPGETTYLPDYVQFRFRDPSGYMVETFWSPPPNFDQMS